MRVAAIDQGTTSTRVLVADTDGKIEIACAITHQQIHPHPGWVEHDPEELLGNIRACLQAAGAVDAIGIDNQGELPRVGCANRRGVIPRHRVAGQSYRRRRRAPEGCRMPKH